MRTLIKTSIVLMALVCSEARADEVEVSGWPINLDELSELELRSSIAQTPGTDDRVHVWLETHWPGEAPVNLFVCGSVQLTGTAAAAEHVVRVARTVHDDGTCEWNCSEGEALVAPVTRSLGCQRVRLEPGDRRLLHAGHHRMPQAFAPDDSRFVDVELFVEDLCPVEPSCAATLSAGGGGVVRVIGLGSEAYSLVRVLKLGVQAIASPQVGSEQPWADSSVAWPIFTLEALASEINAATVTSFSRYLEFWHDLSLTIAVGVRETGLVTAETLWTLADTDGGCDAIEGDYRDYQWGESDVPVVAAAIAEQTFYGSHSGTCTPMLGVGLIGHVLHSASSQALPYSVLFTWIALVRDWDAPEVVAHSLTATEDGESLSVSLRARDALTRPAAASLLGTDAAGESFALPLDFVTTPSGADGVVSFALALDLADSPAQCIAEARLAVVDEADNLTETPVQRFSPPALCPAPKPHVDADGDTATDDTAANGDADTAADTVANDASAELPRDEGDTGEDCGCRAVVTEEGLPRRLWPAMLALVLGMMSLRRRGARQGRW